MPDQFLSTVLDERLVARQQEIKGKPRRRYRRGHRPVLSIACSGKVVGRPQQLLVVLGEQVFVIVKNAGPKSRSDRPRLIDR
jgi:hypothetical protein